MGEQLLEFHGFPDEQTALDFGEQLTNAGIFIRVEKIPKILMEGIIGRSSSPDFVIKLYPSDFKKAHEALNQHYRRLLNRVDKDHYLYSFTNAELIEIIQKPDEWGFLDYQLALKLLAERGIEITEVDANILKEKRKQDLAKPDKPGLTLYIIAYFLLFPVFFIVSPGNLV